MTVGTEGISRSHEFMIASSVFLFLFFFFLKEYSIQFIISDNFYHRYLWTLAYLKSCDEYLGVLVLVCKPLIYIVY